MILTQIIYFQPLRTILGGIQLIGQSIKETTKLFGGIYPLGNNF